MTRKKTPHASNCERHRLLSKKLQLQFDRLLCKKKKQYCKGLLLQIEQCNTKDPVKFWKYVQNLGPCKKETIPWVIEDEGQLITDRTQVLDKWSESFKNLYQIDELSFDNNFKEYMLQNSSNKESTGKLGVENLNRELSMQEVKDAIMQSKNNKSVGIDLVSNEILKNDNIIELMFTFLH